MTYIFRDKFFAKENIYLDTFFFRKYLETYIVQVIKMVG